MSRTIGMILIVSCFSIPAVSQSVPCSAITQNPVVLEALLEKRLAAERENDQPEELVLTASELARLQFSPVSVRPGDAFYIEYKGRDFTLFAEYTDRAMTAFDSPSKASPEQWRKGILPFDERIGTGRRVVRLSAVYLGQEPQFQNLRIIRAGEIVFEFAKLKGTGAPKPIIRNAPPSLPCVSSDSPRTNTAYQHLPPNGSYAVAQPVSWFGVPPPSSAPGSVPASAAAPSAMMAPPDPSSGADGNRYKFTGKEFDPESGLYNYGARQYSPNAGRFMSPDPLKIGADFVDRSNPQAWNAYSYVINNPLNAIDPDGLDYYLIGGGQCGKAVKCDQAGLVLGGDGKRVVVTDEQVLSGDVQSTLNRDGSLSITTSAGTFTGFFFDQGKRQPDMVVTALGPNFEALVTAGRLAETGIKAAMIATAPNFIVAGGAALALAGEGTTLAIGSRVVTPSPGQIAHFSRIMAQGGRRALEKSLRTLERRLAEHASKAEQYSLRGSDTNSVRVEIQNFREQIQAIKSLLGSAP